MTTSENHAVDPKKRAMVILSQVAHHRSEMYKWLALGFYEPDSQLVEDLNSGRLAEALRAAVTWLGEDQYLFAVSFASLNAFEAISLERLTADYEQYLASGIDRVPVYESAYRWRDASDILGAGTDLRRSLKQLYSQSGVAISSFPEDHVAVELEYLAFMCENESQEWAAGRNETARQLRRQQRNFLDDHLGRWLPALCAQLTSQVPSSFYGVLASITDNWLKLEHGSGYIAADKQ